jgi:heme-degrading monooxygenase HmoA
MRRSLPVLALVAGLGATPALAQPVTLINVFEVPAGALEETVRSWEAARDFLARQPGYVSTRLHQALTPDARFALINVAVWESPAAFQAATRRMAEELRNPLPEGVRFIPGLYRVVRE